MLLADVVAASSAVARTRSRTAKNAALVDLLRRCPAEEIATVVRWLSGQLPQGRIGTGWRTLAGLSAPAAPAPSLTVAQVDAALTGVAGAAGPGSVGRRSELLNGLLAAATDDEQRFLRSLLTGELRQGALEGLMVDAVATTTEIPVEVVRRAFMLSGSLAATATSAVAGGVGALAAFGLKVGRAVRPMLAAPGGSLDEAIDDLGADIRVEYKLDGARIQVHRDGSDVAVFTRSLREITPAVPELVAWARALPVRAVVLDGESLAVTDDGAPRPFQDSVSLAGSGVQRPHLFDVLHLDGTDLLDEALERRLETLAALAPAEHIPGVTRPGRDGAAEVLRSALAGGFEGVMVKALDSPYAAGRRGRAWQKVKPVHTVDLVVLGAEWGSGRRRGFLSNIHLGALGPDGAPVMVGKTFKGMTDALLAWQTETFPALATRADDATVYLRPELVVEIALDGVQRSTRYPGGLALRFARVVRYRPDKTVAEADTLERLRSLWPGG